MVFLTTNLINGLLLVVLLALYFFLKNRMLHIGAGVGIIILLIQMQAHTLIIALTALFLIGTSYNFIFGQKSLTTYAIGLICGLMVFGLVAAPVSADHGPPHDPLAELPDHVGSVGRVTDQPKMSLLGTEYLPGDEGKLQALITQGEFPIDNAACYASVLFQNESYFLQNVFMSAVDKLYFEGLYTYDFIVPNVTGIYPVMAHCFYNVTDYIDFVVDTEGNFTIQSGEIEDLQVKDNNSLVVSGTSVCNNAYCERTFEFSLPSGFGTPFLTDMRLFLLADTNIVEDFDFHVWNQDIGMYEFWVTISKNNPADEVEQQLQINASYAVNNTVTVRVSSSDAHGKSLAIDLLRMLRNYNGTNVVDLRQNQELVVSQTLTNATFLIINPPAEEILSGETVLNILLLVGIIVAAIGGGSLLSGFLLVLWTIIYSTNIYITIVFLLVAAYLFYRALVKRE